MKRYMIATLLALLLCVPFLSVGAYAEEPGETTPYTEPEESSPDTEPEESAPDTEPEESTPDAEPEESAPDTEPEVTTPIIVTRDVEVSYYSDDESQLYTLELIEYHLRVLVVIVMTALSCLALWFFVLKPITYFIL